MIHATPDPGQVRLAHSRNGFRLAVDSDAEAAHAARQLIAGDDRLPAAVREDVLLAVTELVTNAVRHAGVGVDQSLRVELHWSRRWIRVEVFDPGTSFAQARESFSRHDRGGWGLFLVDRIADRWGIEPAPGGTRAWCEIGLES